MQEVPESRSSSADVTATGARFLLSTPEWVGFGEAEIDRLVRSAFAPREARARTTLRRLVRYGASSAVALGISEVALLIAASFGVSATLSAVIGNLAGVPPSYLLSRYWIWGDTSRRRIGRQVVEYWATSLVSMTFTSLGTGAIASAAPSSGAIHLLAVGGGFLAINFVSWIGKYLIYQRFIFTDRPSADSR
jgi:putative flippase GtrA